MTLQHPIGYDQTGKNCNCSVVAFSVLTGIDYKTVERVAYKAVSASMKRPPSYENWNGGTAGWWTYKGMARDLDVGLTQHIFGRGMTIKTLAKKLAKAKRKTPLIAFTRDHAVVIQGGMILDQSILSHWSDIKGHKTWRLRQRVTSVVTLNDLGVCAVNFLYDGEMPE
jgi:hypothetical protein